MDPIQVNVSPRMLFREFRRRTRHPKRCDSLPCLRLLPEDRPLYVCKRCCSPNGFAELCPWCFGTCDGVVALVAAVVRRRISSPSLLTDTQKMQLVRIEQIAHALAVPQSPTLSPMVATSSPGPRAVDPTRNQPNGASQIQPHAEGDEVRRRHRNAVLYSATDVVATATSDTTLQPFLDQIAAAHQENRERERKSAVSAITTSTIRPSSVRASRPLTPQTPPPTPPPSTIRTHTRTRMSNEDEDLTHTSEPPTPTSRSRVSATASPTHSLSSSLLLESQTPCLRRKRRMPVLRQRSSCSLRRRATTSSISSFCRDSTTSPPASPRPKSTSTTTSLGGATCSPGPPGRKVSKIRFSTPPPGSSPNGYYGHGYDVPLGHPQRPLYTAIRKNMSRPESPSPPPSIISSALPPIQTAPMQRAEFDASFQTLVYEAHSRQTRSLDIDTPVGRYGSLSRASSHVVPFPIPIPIAPVAAAAHTCARPALFTAASGGSVSGETELRMDLARSRSMDGVPGDFAFREMRRAREGEREASVKTKVKNFGKTIKGLLRVKM